MKFDGAMDISVVKHEYISIVIGSEDVIRSSIKRLRYGFPIHMSKLGYKKIRNNVLARSDFRNKEIMAFCVKIDRESTIDMVVKKTKKRVAKKRIRRTFDRLLSRNLKPHLLEYLQRYRLELDDITFQCDYDCLSFSKEAGLKHAKPAAAHMLADIVAWANTHNIDIAGVVELDMVEDIRKEVLRLFR